ncbi:MAG: hypothetical protein U0X91_29760 [Spirosomataceae bacterium]
MNKEAQSLKKCRELIEKKLAWGNSESWQNQDFENLSERIFEETRIRLSTSTLKRLWGKIPYDSTPNLGTLNALAQLAGYDNWRVFSNAQMTLIPGTPKASLAVSITRPSHFKFSVCLCLLIVLIPRSLSAFWNYTPGLRYHHISLNSQLATKGLPNTAFIHYDATHSNADSVFIQLNHDSRQRIQVDKHKYQWAQTYYTPGVYPIQLVLNDSVVQNHDLIIETDGWLRMVNRHPIPVYFPENQTKSSQPIGISVAELEQANVRLSQSVPWVSLYKVQKTMATPSQRFVMEATLRNTFNRGDGICQQTKIVLLGTKGTIVIPLCAKGCVADLQVTVNHRVFDGHTEDLSGLGVDFKEWVAVRCEVQSGTMSVFINDKPAFSRPIEHHIGTIAGTRIQFLGTGEVKRFEMKRL